MPGESVDIDDFLLKLRILRKAYADAGLLGAEDSPDGHSSSAAGLLQKLHFCDAIARNILGTARGPGKPAHVCVFGGTQVGKSTMVNVLAGQTLAQVYHTAGFTRHAQAFGPGLTCDSFRRQFPRTFPGFSCVSREALSLERPNEFSVSSSPEFPFPGEVVLWDAPDCDAIDARQYQQGLVEALTIADLVVYVTSREKYAVNHLLEWLHTLLLTGASVIGVLNMTPKSQQAELVQSMAEALAGVQSRHGEAPPRPLLQTVVFDYVNGGDSTPLYNPRNATSGDLQNAVVDALSKLESNYVERKRSASLYLEKSIVEIAAPARTVLNAREQWNQSVNEATARFVDDYRSGYLDDPERYDAFKQVGVEILKLLNPPVPGLQKTLYAVRTVLSLPARAIILGSRAVWRFAQTGSAQHGPPAIPNEVGTYQEAHARVLNAVSGKLSSQQGTGSREEQVFWSAVSRLTSEKIGTVQREFEQKLAEHRARTDEWVQQTARGIYVELAKDPMKLNLLRTGRIAADAGAIIVAVHTGGHGNILHDLIVTPAVMSVIEAISQQIAGSYVEARRLELRDRLLADTKVFAEEIYGKTLRGFADKVMEQTGFATINAQLLDEISDVTTRMCRV